MAEPTTRPALDHWLAARLLAERHALSSLWLARVEEYLAADQQQLLPAHQLHGHVPELVEQIAGCLGEAGGDNPALNMAPVRSAVELGQLRYVQHATVHQLLREHQILATLLEDFVERQFGSLTQPPDALAAIGAQRRVQQAVRVLQDQALEAFVGEHTKTIERQTAQLRKFSRLVSHEIRQPLGVLQVITRALSVNAGDVDAARMMDIFSRSVTRLAGVTSDLERLARITKATDLSPSEQQVDLSVVAAAVADQLAAMAAARDVQVRVHANLPVLRLDVARAELVLINLIANGIKYADPQKPRRCIDVYGVSSEQPTVIVQDNGIGIPADQLQNIFREFVRAHAQRDSDFEVRGLGLGLAIVRECMDAANGAVHVESQQGIGTTFKLTWSRGENVQNEERGS